MGKTFKANGPGLKTSSAFRRLQDGRGRGRAAWREAKTWNDHAYAGEVARRAATPKLVKRQFVAVPLAEFLASVPEVDVL